MPKKRRLLLWTIHSDRHQTASVFRRGHSGNLKVPFKPDESNWRMQHVARHVSLRLGRNWSAAALAIQKSASCPTF